MVENIKKEASLNKILQRLKELKTDIWYSKDKHFNASSRITEECNNRKTILIFLIIMISLSSVINIEILNFFDSFKYWNLIKIIIAFIGIICGSIATYITSGSPISNLVELSFRHKQSGEKLNFLFKKVKFYESSIDHNTDAEDLNKKLHTFLNEQNEICSSSPLTTSKDYEKAQKNFKNKTWEYKEKELNL